MIPGTHVYEPIYLEASVRARSARRDAAAVGLVRSSSLALSWAGARATRLLSRAAGGTEVPEML